ncbi:visual pigment-like receptor peropsin [Branchiostoma lanceolatum]|uniref:visual pigment-like receptor peropsin n=1 Tax=Branchiostoma lanceolatum TaxID=7740 RepID=UPI003456D2A3
MDVPTEMPYGVEDDADEGGWQWAQTDKNGFHKYDHLIVGLYLFVIGIIGTVENGVTLATFTKFRSLRSPTTMLLVHLAIADLGICIFGYPFSGASSLRSHWPFGGVGCQWYGFNGMFFGMANIGLLTCVAVDRYLVICRQDLADKVNYNTYGVMAALGWLFAAFWAALPLVGWGEYALEPSGTACTINWRKNDSLFTSYVTTCFTLGFALPLAVMMFCYLQASWFVSKVLKGDISGDLTFPVASNVDWEYQNHFSKMCLAMVAAFVVAWTPYSVLFLFAAFGDPADIPGWITLLPPLIAKSSALYNPIIYIIANRRFRSAICSMLKGQDPDEEDPNMAMSHDEHRVTTIEDTDKETVAMHMLNTIT